MTHPNREELAGEAHAIIADLRVTLTEIRADFARIMGERDAFRARAISAEDRLAAALRQPPSVEEVARVIDPAAMARDVESVARGYAGAVRAAELRERQQAALAKAQAIAALYQRGGTP